MPDQLLDALRQFYGYDAFRPQQRETIAHVLNGGDALVLMPTGGGKSLCYQLPALLSGGLTVVVSPLIALMHDQVSALRRLGAPAAYLNSTLSLTESMQVERLVESGSLRLLYVAPERVNTDRFRDLLERCPPSLIAIDEAHCISQWGHEFRPDYRLLRRLTERFVDVPTIACTATATPQVQGDIIDQLDRPRMNTFDTSFMRDNLTVRVVPKRRSTDQLVARLRQMPGESAIVYVQSRKNTEEIAQRLRQYGIKAEYYHAGMGGAERHAVQDRFLSGATSVICATIAFGMGIDKPDIRLVAHLDMPPNIESYYQEIGRAGRDGAPSECLLFYTKGVWHQQMFFINQLQDTAEREQRITRLRTMMNFCEQSSCRWTRILNYFGESPAVSACGHCDNCLGETQEPLAEPRAAEPPEPPPDDLRPLTEAEEPLYEALKRKRLQLASEQAVSAFIVASNRDLAALVRAKPSSLAELRRVKGFGAKRADNYGEALLAVITEYAGPQNPPTLTLEEEPPVQSELMPPASAPDDQQDGPPPETWQQRFNTLSDWRSATSAEARCDPSALLTFPAMRELAESPPPNLSALAAVDGVSVLVIERYAERLLELLGQRPAPDLFALPAAAPTGATAAAASAKAANPPSWQLSADLYEDGHTVLAIAERRMLSPGTVASHLSTAIKQGQPLDLQRSLPAIDFVQQVRRLLSENPDASASELHERLEHRLSQPELRLVLTYLRPPEPDA